MREQTKEAWIGIGSGLLIALLGIGIAAVTRGGYIAVGGIVFGLIVMLRGAWHLPRAVLLGLGAPLVAVVVGLVAIGRSRARLERESEAIGKISDPTQVGRLIGVLSNSEHGRMRGYAAEALGRIGDQRALAPLIDALNVDLSTSRKSQGPLRRALGDLVGEAPGRAGYWVQFMAIGGLQSLNDPRALGPLLDVLGDARGEGNQYWAMSAIEKIAGHELDAGYTSIGSVSEERVEAWQAWWSNAHGSWRTVEKDVGPFSPARRWIVSFRDGDGDGKALFLGCVPSGSRERLAAVIDWARYLDAAAGATLSQRIADRNPQPTSWQVRGSFTYLEGAETFARELVAAHPPRFTATLQVAEGDSLSFQASVDGLDSALRELVCAT